jgi:hypothetical protein|tara:strand:- start:1125 stop:1574 length:450 start_codon:yes stop_codon:yes gene_type:complete
VSAIAASVFAASSRRVVVVPSVVAFVAARVTARRASVRVVRVLRVVARAGARVVVAARIASSRGVTSIAIGARASKPYTLANGPCVEFGNTTATTARGDARRARRHTTPRRGATRASARVGLDRPRAAERERATRAIAGATRAIARDAR